jgi:hypothetical protein
MGIILVILNGGVGLTADNGSHPQLSRVERYHHAGLAYVQTVNHGQAAMVVPCRS